MPMYQFKCECGNEFEQIVPSNPGLFKWCKTCDQLTRWVRNNERELVCDSCAKHKNQDGSAMQDDRSIQKSAFVEPEGNKTAICPSCGQQAEHVLKVEYHGKENIGSSSIRFHFNYL